MGRILFQACDTVNNFLLLESKERKGKDDLERYFQRLQSAFHLQLSFWTLAWLKHEEWSSHRTAFRSEPPWPGLGGSRSPREHPGPWEGRAFKAASSSASGLPAALALLCGKSAALCCRGLGPEAEPVPSDGPFETKRCSSVVSPKGCDGRVGMGVFSKNTGASRSGTGVISS